MTDMSDGAPRSKPALKSFEGLVKETFEAFDVNSNGSLDAEEIRQVGRESVHGTEG